MTGFILAMGGGGFLMEPDNPLLDLHALALSGRARPTVLFVGTASGDNPDAQLRFYKAFSRYDCRPRHLDLFRFDRRLDLSSLMAEADVVYVGGGNTPAMLAVWELYGLQAMLRSALRRGAVLAGVSAGANCWFERAVTDSIPGGGLIECLGLVPGIFCPHFDSDRWRRPFIEGLLARQPAAAGFACDDSCALVLDANGQVVDAVTSVEGRSAFRLEAGRVVPLPTRLLSSNAS